MIEIDFNYFFDKPKVVNKVDKGIRKSLSKAGAYVRTSASSSIRARKKPAKPGNPPSSHTKLLKKNIFFVYKPETKSVVIGPNLLPSTRGNKKAPKPVPAILEGGGPSITYKGKPAIYKKYPYMEPAFKKNVSKFPEFFGNMFDA